MTYAANFLQTVSNSLLFRYSDFVTFCHGTEVDLGWIVGVGMVGSLSMRLFQGTGIDRYGARLIWLSSSLLCISSLFGHLLITRVDQPGVYILRIVYQTAVSGFFGSSITFVSGQAPVMRVAEVVGTLGTSGFAGMVVGTQIGDAIARATDQPESLVHYLFLGAACLSGLSLMFSILATRNYTPPAKRTHPPIIVPLRRYHPGRLMLVAAAMGFGLGLPSTFLRPFSKELGIEEIGGFFMIYAPTGFVARLLTRHHHRKHGINLMITQGLLFMIAGMLSFLFVSNRWQLAIPAVFIGIAHAMLFPAVLAGGVHKFPTRFRGLGTTLILSMNDMGMLIATPLQGEILHVSKNLGLASYPSMFVAVAAALLLVLLYFVSDGRLWRDTETAENQA